MPKFWKKVVSDFPQITINHPVEVTGYAFRWFSAKATVRFIPREKEGIVFRFESQEIAALSKNVVFDEKHCTTLKSAGLEIRETEHVLSAVYGLGITNLIIELEGVPEPPILDGSTRPFVALLLEAGLKTLSPRRHEYIIQKAYRFEVSGSESWITVEPADTCSIEMFIDFPEPIGKQALAIHLSPAVYAADISFARAPLRCALEETTEILLREWFVGYEQNQGAILRYSKGKYVDPLRIDDEVVRHKILDFIGDIANIGCPIRGRFRCHKVGHKINGEFAKLFSQ